VLLIETPGFFLGSSPIFHLVTPNAPFVRHWLLWPALSWPIVNLLLATQRHHDTKKPFSADYRKHHYDIDLVFLTCMRITHEFSWTRPQQNAWHKLCRSLQVLGLMLKRMVSALEAAGENCGYMARTMSYEYEVRV
jgi:hypothetical protein